MAEKNSGIPVKRRSTSYSNNQSLNGERKLKSSPTHSTDTAVQHADEQSDLTRLSYESSECGTEREAVGGRKAPERFVKNTEAVLAEPKQQMIIFDTGQNILYYILLVFMTILGLATRLHRIEIPPWICWDETHFGKMGSWYIKRSFFFDVHPPLGKMLIGLSGYLTGYDGEFPFDKPGDDFGEVNYVGMRMFCGILGAALVPLTYMSTWLLCHSVTASLFASSFVLFDTGVLTLSRHILLDPILMFFIMAATYCLLKFLSLRNRPYSFGWWLWLVWCGVFLACSIGVKFVGLFVILLAGYSTLTDLWRLLGDQALSLVEIFKHFLARAVCLIAVPAVCYMIIFAVHFKVLSKSGNGDGFYSSQFQSQLEGNMLHNISMPEYMAYGSVISLKQRRTGGGYLHSHWHLYPEEVGPRQQQVTTYSHKDENNLWRIKPPLEEPEIDMPPIYVKNGDLIRLEHIVTRRNLHSHREPAPMTQRHFQVSGYGHEGAGDANDVWMIDIPGVEEGARVLAVRSKMKLIHYHVKCALQSHDKKLPKWGWDQLEVSCNPNIKDPKTYWSVEMVHDTRLPNVSFEVYSPSFLDKLIESHSVMTQGNSGLKPKEGEVTSRPWQWPLNLRDNGKEIMNGCAMCNGTSLNFAPSGDQNWDCSISMKQGQIFSGKDHRIYLLGNPVIFWAMLVFMGLFLLLYVIHTTRRQRGVKISEHLNDYCDRTFTACWWFMVGWGLHYIPFWPMTRVLYFHHYFPAFLYSAMLSGVILDYIIRRLSMLVPSSLSLPLFHWLLGCVLSAVAYSFYLFHPLSYGMSGTHASEETSEMYGLKWLDSWEL